jgi:exosortase/archaeosortase family protein
VLVLVGNVLRNAVLVACEAVDRHLPGWAHEAVGLAVLAAVCAAIGWIVQRPPGVRHV